MASRGRLYPKGSRGRGSRPKRDPTPPSSDRFGRVLRRRGVLGGSLFRVLWRTEQGDRAPRTRPSHRRGLPFEDVGRVSNGPTSTLSSEGAVSSRRSSPRDGIPIRPSPLSGQVWTRGPEEVRGTAREKVSSPKGGEEERTPSVMVEAAGSRTPRYRRHRPGSRRTLTRPRGNFTRCRGVGSDSSTSEEARRDGEDTDHRDTRSRPRPRRRLHRHTRDTFDGRPLDTFGAPR